MKNQSKLEINGVTFAPLVIAEYSLLFDLFDLDLTDLNSLPDSLLERILTLVSSKACDEIISPLELMTAAYAYISHHISEMNAHPRILSVQEQDAEFDKKHVQELKAAGLHEEAKKIEQQLHQKQLQNRFDNRSYNRQIKQLEAEAGKSELQLLQWCMSVSQSDITNLSVSELQNLEWKPFIDLNNQSQILSNLHTAAENDAKAAQKLAENANRTPTPPNF